MPFSPINVVNGTTPVNATWGNNAQLQYQEATLSFNPDFFTASFVVSGLVCTADGVTLNQLDVTSGTSYLLQADGTTRQRKTSASVANQFLTSVINSTYYLWLNPDGTFTFSTSGSPPQTGSLNICQAATNGSGNISSVTDTRNLNPAMLPTIAGGLVLPPLANIQSIGGFNPGTGFPSQLPALGGTVAGHLFTGGTFEIQAPTGAPPSGMTAALAAGANMGIGAYKYVVTFYNDDGETLQSVSTNITTTSGNQAVNLSAIPTVNVKSVAGRRIYRTQVGGSTYTLLTTIADRNVTTTYSDTATDASISGNAAPPVHPSLGGSLKILNSTPSVVAQIFGDGAFSFDAGNIFSDGAGTITIAGNFSWGAAVGGSRSALIVNNASHASELWTPQSGAANGYLFVGWNGSAQVLPFQVGATAFSTPAQIDNSGNLKANSVNSLNGVATAGPYGVPTIAARTIDQVISNTTATTIATVTVPATDQPCRIHGWFNIGSGNTNAGTITFKVTYTDPYLGTAQTQFLTLSNGNFVALNAASEAKGAGQYDVYPYLIHAKASTAISVVYQNSAAGTISDKVSAIFEFI